MGLQAKQGCADHDGNGHANHERRPSQALLLVGTHARIFIRTHSRHTRRRKTRNLEPSRLHIIWYTQSVEFCHVPGIMTKTYRQQCPANTIQQRMPPTGTATACFQSPGANGGGPVHAPEAWQGSLGVRALYGNLLASFQPTSLSSDVFVHVLSRLSLTSTTRWRR